MLAVVTNLPGWRVASPASDLEKAPDADWPLYPTTLPVLPVMFGRPNITGYTGAAWDDLSGDVTGAFYFSKNATEAGNGLSGYWGISFDASRVTSAYGRSSTVQPASTRLLYCIKS